MRGLTLFLAAGTSYIPDYNQGFLGDLPHDRLEKILAAASTKSFDQLEAEHIADYQQYFQRLKIELGASDPALAACQSTSASKNTKASRCFRPSR